MAIEAYVVELGRALRGPRRAKEELLEEVHGGLVDAAQAYASLGLDRETAEDRAVADFGDVVEVAPACQAELGLAQSRRTAMLVLVILLSQPLVWEHAWPAVAGIHVWEPTPVFVVADQVVGWLAVTASVGSLAAALACGIGVRYLGARRALARATGVFAITVTGVFAVSGAALAVLSPQAGPLGSAAGALWWTVFLVVPLTWIGVSARRCLAAA